MYLGIENLRVVNLGNMDRIKELKSMKVAAAKMLIPVLSTKISLLEQKVSRIHGEKCKRIIEEEASNLSVNGAF